MVTPDTRSKTSAQIALEDNIFQELFGMVWENGGFVLRSSQDLSWAIFYKDVFLQGLSDYANDGFVKLYGRSDEAVRRRREEAHGSAKEWVAGNGPYENPAAVERLERQIQDTVDRFKATSPTEAETKAFGRKLARAREALEDREDPFSFDRCCEVLGLRPEVARARFVLYRKLKLKHGNSIRIVTYTGKKKDVNIPSLDDIIVAEEANGEHDLTLFLHVGIKRELRNSALVRSKNERSDQRNFK